MKTQGDTNRPHSVKAEFDPDFCATPMGGAVLVEQTMRGLGVRRAVEKHLPERAAQAKYSMLDGAMALMAALIVGGKGISAAEILRQDPLASEIFGLDEVPSESTMYRVLCRLSGLVERSQAEWYEPAGPAQASLDMFGAEKRESATRRLVPFEAEAADAEHLAALEAFVAAIAKACFQKLNRNDARLCDWWVVFGDATDAEVEGRCFDAARKGRDGKKALRWQTLMLGCLIVAQRLMEGNRDEGVEMPALLAKARQTVHDMAGKGRVLALLDAAYFEKQVIDLLSGKDFGWDFIVCANQQRVSLERLALEQPEAVWQATGPDAGRGWAESQAACFTHTPEGWASPVTIVARRWREVGELPEAAWHWSFLATRIEPANVPAKLRKHGYCQAIWMLYGTKQGRETHYKTPLRDLDLHHPPSGRLGLDQAFYALASAASNIAMVMRYRVVKEERGIELWRLRERYFRIAGTLARRGRTLWVRLAGGSTDALRQAHWLKAFAAAARL
jgi:hypothetical protein